MNLQKILTDIETKTGLKCTASKYPFQSSMRGYLKIRPAKQNGVYPCFDFNQMRELKEQNPGALPNENFYSISEISLYMGVDIYGEPKINQTDTKQVKEYKPKSKSWGGKNSQMRLDKATARNAKRLRAGTTARYY